MMKVRLSESQITKINLTLDIFKCQIELYNSIKTDPNKLDAFFSLNRNPLFDLTGISYFRTGLESDGVIAGGKPVHDHFIQRKHAMKILFERLSENKDMTFDDFVVFLVKYGSTVAMTKEEHQVVTTRAKNTTDLNYELYEQCGIVIEGLDKIIPL
jgi:hypothetical protein